MKTSSINAQPQIKTSEALPSKDNMLTWILAQVKEKGSVFQVPAMRPTFIFSGREALAVLDDPALVERSLSVVPSSSYFIAKSLCDDNVDVLSLTNGAEHERRRKSWLKQGVIDREWIVRVLPTVEEIIQTTLGNWQALGVFSLNLEVRRFTVQMAAKLVLGCDSNEQMQLDIETLIGLNEGADHLAAKERILAGIDQQAAHYETAPEKEQSMAARLADSGELSRDELLNELKHGLISTFNIWVVLVELLRQPSTDALLSTELVAETALLAGNHSLRNMSKTPRLMSLINNVLRLTSPLPLFYARAKTEMTVAGIHIPENAVLIGALHATNQLLAHNDTGSETKDVTFGMGAHQCPAMDMTTVTLWLFAVKFFDSCQLQVRDDSDLPIQKSTGYYPERGCFVSLSSDAIAPGQKCIQSSRVNSVRSVEGDRKLRIAIVGAGITGLTLAHELRKKGFEYVTVLEKAESVGGKADTVFVDGKPYNVGAHLCSGDHGVGELAAEVGVPMERAMSYVLWDLEENKAVPRLYQDMAEFDKLRKYLVLHPEIDSPAGFAEAESAMYATVNPWLEVNGLDALKEIGSFFTGAGYGFMDEDVPAAFFLKFAKHMSDDGWTPTGGYKYLLDTVSKGMNVRCSTEVVDIDRSLAESSGIRITTRKTGDGVENSEAATNQVTEIYDRVILTGPLEHTQNYLDQSAQETLLFSRILSDDYYTVIATVDIDVPHEAGLYIVPGNTLSRNQGSRLTAFARIIDGTLVYHFYCYGEKGQSEADILEQLEQDIQKMGGKISEVHYFQCWAYSPRVSSHDMALGFHKQLDGMQGERGTYFAGSLLAFELTDHNVRLAKSLVERFFSTESADENLPENELQLSLPEQALASINNIDAFYRVPASGTQSILEILKERYEQTPEMLFSTFLDVKCDEVRSLTYKELVERAIAVAVSLKDRGVKQGERVALVYPPETDEFLIGFFGCLMAEAVAVPVACPDPRKLNIEIPRFSYMMQDCDCHVALTTRLYHRVSLSGRTSTRVTESDSSRNVSWPELTWIITDGLSPIAPSPEQPIPAPAANTLAYLQYTSGSTSNPKGVMINHGNMLYNVDAIRRETNVDQSSVLVGWVPMFHDMGLVGGPLTAIYCQARLVFFSPVSFLKKPFLWLEAIHRYRGTHTASPNFGYEFLLHNLDDALLDDIDLSCLKRTLFGGEVMRHRTFERMAKRLYQTGFRSTSMTNIFGAAEGTLYLAGGVLDETPLLCVNRKLLETKNRAVPCSPDFTSTSTLIGCGVPQSDCDIRIIDPETTRLLPEGRVGEIWISSPSISAGYWGRPTEDNDKVFRARVDNDPAPRCTYLRSGDLGFIERNVLYICGRVKEMMIFNGRNIHPMDVELSIMSVHPAIRQGCVVAFSVEEDEQEKLVLIAEVKKDDSDNMDAVIDAIAHELASKHNLACKSILLVRNGTLPKTSSGKLQRYKARELFLSNSLKQVYVHEADMGAVNTDLSVHINDALSSYEALESETFTADVAETRHWLKRLFAMSFHVGADEISHSLSFDEFGIDSAQALTITARISRYIGAELTPSVIYEQSTIDLLSLFLCKSREKNTRALIKLQNGDSALSPTLFCIHPAGGSSMAYFGLVEELPDHIPVYAFGNENDAIPSDDLVVMAKHYLDEMKSVQAEGPYYLLGYSFGGTVAFEMAKQIMVSGGEIGGVYIIDSPAPFESEDKAGQDVTRPDGYASFFDTAILNRLIPDYLDDKGREKMALRIDQNNRALAGYKPEAGYKTEAGISLNLTPRIRMLRASDEARNLRGLINHPAFDCPDFGWEDAAPGSIIEIVHVPGDHFSVMNQPRLIAEILLKWLENRESGKSTYSSRQLHAVE